MTTKKIGVLTFYKVNNYGAELQAFALHYKLKALGYDNELINYPYIKNKSHRRSKRSRPILNNSRINRLKDFILKCLDDYSKMRYPSVAALRRSRFEAFYKQHVSLSPLYPSIDDLYNASLDYTCYIVGSDQVWNPNNQTNIAPYFLTFAPEKVKKIAYASSFGVGTIPSGYKEKMKDLLMNIDFLSCREQSGVAIIKELTGIKASHVVDPTMLLTKKEWIDLSIPFDFEEPYLLLFIFKPSKYVDALVKRFKAQTGLRVLRICKNEMPLEKDQDILNLRDLGPAEFLGVFNKASFVLTTSFHGSIFSILFEKPFFSITPGSKNNNARQESLLNKLGLEDRLLTEGSPIPTPEEFDLDYEAINPLVATEREKSIQFLNESLKA